MTRDEFNHRVLSHTKLDQQIAAAHSAIAEAATFAESRLSSEDTRLEAIHRLKEVQGHIIGLLEVPLPEPAANRMALGNQRMQLVTDATMAWSTQVTQFRYDLRHRVQRRPFRVENAGLPPFRDSEQGELRVRSVSARSEPIADGRTFDFADVEPYVDPHISKRRREANALCWVEPGRIEPHHLRSDKEESLVGQQGLFARVDIPAGTCVGVYGGQILDEADLFLVSDDSYLMGISTTRPNLYAINGEHLLSLSNTLYNYDDQGRRKGHPEAGYDLHGAKFRVEIAPDWVIAMPAFFAIREIPAGTELRWNYMLQALASIAKLAE